MSSFFVHAKLHILCEVLICTHMNVVMYPEITGEVKPKAKHDMSKMGKKSEDKMDGMKMGAEQYNANALSDIVTLNYAMLKSPTPSVVLQKSSLT